MGGFGSGRARRHVSIVDCLEIDLSWLRKKKLLLRPGKFRIEWQKWTETNFSKRKEHHYQMLGRVAFADNLPAALTLTYTTEMAGKEHKHQHTLQLTNTACNYGGQRWWFRSPCCGRRVRVLYIKMTGSDVARMTPQCRNCLDLHYASQQQSYVERHKAYERHLLANYGYTWAKWEYDTMKRHYQEMTPELAYIARRSELARELEITRLLIRTQRILLRSHVHALSTLKSEEDRRLYLDHLIKEHGTNYALDLVRMLKIGIQLERAAYELSPVAFENAYKRVCSALPENEEDRQLLEEALSLDKEVEEMAQQASKVRVAKPEHVMLYLENLFEKQRELEGELKEIEDRRELVAA